MKTIRRIASAAGLVAATSMIALSCVSERSTGVVDNGDTCGVQLPTEAFGSTIVKIQNFAFSPSNVRIRPGTKVTWVNCETSGSESHTSTADATGGWSSPLLPSGATFTTEFTTAGVNPYHCEPHPGMKGTVTVE